MPITSSIVKESPTNASPRGSLTATAVEADLEASSSENNGTPGAVVDVAPVPPSKRRGKKRKHFGFSSDTRTQPARILDPLDYEAKYAPDPINEETAPNARVWRMCADEIAIFDTDLSEDTRDTVDVLLVFAGLFSAVVTSFLALVSAELQTDFTEVSSTIMYELLVVQRAIGNGSSVDLAPVVASPDTPFIPSQSSIWVNGLWYTSLSLSLITALVASLAKQWIHQYTATVSSGSPRDRCMIRQYRYDGFQKWGVPFIIGTLPVLMHLSLGLFFVGLTVYLIQLYVPLAYIAGSLAGMTYVAYFVSHAISAIYLQCPYRTPLSNLLFVIRARAAHHVHTFLSTFYSVPTVSSRSSVRFSIEDVSDDLGANDSAPRSLRDAESADVGRRPDYAIDVLRWMIRTTANSTARSLIHQAIGSFPFNYTNKRIVSYAEAFRPDSQELNSLGIQLANADDAGSRTAGLKTERIFRAAHVMQCALSFEPNSRLATSLKAKFTSERWPSQLAASAIGFGIHLPTEAERILRDHKLLLHPRVWLRFFERLPSYMQQRTVLRNHPSPSHTPLRQATVVEGPKPWEMALFYRLFAAPHSEEDDLAIFDHPLVTCEQMIGRKDVSYFSGQVLLVLSSFHSEVAYGVHDPWTVNTEDTFRQPHSEKWRFRIRITILKYYHFVLLHEDQYSGDQGYPSALNELRGAVREILSHYRKQAVQAFLQNHQARDIDNVMNTEDAHFLSQQVTRWFSERPIPPKWIDLDDIRKEALWLTIRFEFQGKDLLFYRTFYRKWFSPSFISALLAPVVKETSPSDDINQYVLPAVTMVEIGIRSSFPEAFNFFRTNNLLNYLFPYHRYPPVYSLVTRYVAVLLELYAHGRTSHRMASDLAILLSAELDRNWQYLSSGRPLALVTVVLLSLPSDKQYAIPAKDADQQPDVYKILRDLWSGESDTSRAGLSYAEVFVTDMVRPDSEYWTCLRVFDEDTSFLRVLDKDERSKLQEELKSRWLTFKGNVVGGATENGVQVDS